MTLYAELYEKYRSRGVLIDSNLLLLYVIGQYDRDLIARFKRTAQYEIDDYELVERVFTLFRTVVTLPNVLTEVSNLAGQLSDGLRASVFRTLGERIELLSEHYLASGDVAEEISFNRFGLSDVAMAMLAKDRLLVLTDDFRLSLLLTELQVEHVNLNHLRSPAWLGQS
jgi:hypothetical protein